MLATILGRKMIKGTAIEECMCAQSTYLCRKKSIQETLCFGKDHNILPVVKSGGMYDVKLQRFRCVFNEANNEKFYQAKALVSTEACAEKKISFTVSQKYLLTLEDFDIKRVDRRANKWDLPTGGDKGDNYKVSSVVEMDNTVKNPFTHTPADQPICLLLSALSAL